MTTEAIVKRLPMVFVDAVPGCETRNFDFLSSNEVAEGTRSWRQAINRTVLLLEHEEELEEQKEAMARFCQGVAAEQICRCVVGE